MHVCQVQLLCGHGDGCAHTSLHWRQLPLPMHGCFEHWKPPLPALTPQPICADAMLAAMHGRSLSSALALSQLAFLEGQLQLVLAAAAEGTRC